MKPYLALLCTLALLTACGDRATPKESFAKLSDPARTGVSAPDRCSPLPANVELGFPYHLKSDYYYLNVKKMIRRSVVLQYLNTDSEAADRLLREAMLKAGFTFHDLRKNKDGMLHYRFHLKGYGMAHVRVRPVKSASEDGGSVVNGTMTFDLPPPAFNPPVKSNK